jgi:hypothetical protein
MTEFADDMSEIESISKRLEMTMNPSRITSRAARADSTIQWHRKEKRHINTQGNHPHLHEPRDRMVHPIGLPFRS